MWIRTLPVYSKLAEEEIIPQEIKKHLKGWRLSQHQLDTYRALTEGSVDVVFNTAMTGDGKSLAGQLPVLVRQEKTPLMAMYPTNELVYDQLGQLARTKDHFAVDFPTETLNRETLDQIMAQDYNQRGDALLGVLRNCDIALTNPDIFHLVMHQFYVRPDDAPDKLIGPLVNRFHQFTFDEFHIFDLPQVVSVLNALLFIHEMAGPSRPHKFLFLSATPGEMMLEYLDRSGLAVQTIEGRYYHGETEPTPEQWRKILHGSTIHVDTLSVEGWVEQHLDDTLLPFFLERRPRAKGAIIVNSVAAAMRLLNQLRPAFAAHGLRVEPNTGLISRRRRAISYEADLLIGTSTVDVGVDFQINLLLFESRDAGSFLQRLGRLGRHEGYHRDGEFYPFEDYAAYAMIPQWVQEALFVGREGAKALLQGEETLDRQSLSRAVQIAYPQSTTFDRYTRDWGVLQSVRVLRGLNKKTVKEQYTQMRPRLEQRYETTFGVQLRPVFSRYRDLLENQPALLDEAVSFRGSSYFNCCVIDKSEEGSAQLKALELFQLLGGAQLRPLSEEAFYSAATAAGFARHVFERQEPLAFFEMNGWSDERTEYQLVLNQDIIGWGADRFGRAALHRGFSLDAQVPGLSALNNHLSRREIPSLLIPGYHPQEVKRRLRLPLLFSVLPFESRDGVKGTVAFGREALLLETRLQYSRLDCGGGAIVL